MITTTGAVVELVGKEVMTGEVTHDNLVTLLVTNNVDFVL